jgi:hypothetical protein
VEIFLLPPSTWSTAYQWQQVSTHQHPMLAVSRFPPWCFSSWCSFLGPTCETAQLVKQLNGYRKWTNRAPRLPGACTKFYCLRPNKLPIPNTKIVIQSFALARQALYCLSQTSSLFCFCFCLFIYSYVHTLFGPFLPLPTSSLFCSVYFLARVVLFAGAGLDSN